MKSMTSEADRAVGPLLSEAYGLLKSFRRVNSEVNKVESSDGTYLSLLKESQQERENIRSRILRLYGVLGKHFPDVSPELGRLIDPDQIGSSEFLQNYLKMEHVLEVLLRGLGGKATARQLGDVLSYLDIDKFKMTEQSLDLVVKSHPELFGVENHAGSRFYILKTPSIPGGNFSEYSPSRER